MMDLYCLLVTFLIGSAYGQLDFRQDNGFQLSASKTFFQANDDVTFTCAKSANRNSDSPRSLVFPDNKGISWERNGQSLFTTSSESGNCRVQAEILLGRPAVTQRELEAVTCVEDDMSVKVTIRNVTISPQGDRWICSKFPFVESNAVTLHNFVALSDVTLTVRDHFPNDANTGILMTLICRASPCNPPPSLTWQLLRGAQELPLPGQSRTRSQVDNYGRVVMVAEVSLSPDPRYENVTAMCRGSNTADVWINSQTIVLTVKRSPRILMTANPSNEIIEGTDVTLTCGAHGHPRPEVRWRKKEGYLPGGLMEADTPIIRLSPARLTDEGQYVCKASNGVPPDSVNSIYLKVEEPVRTLEISDENRSTEINEKGSGNSGDKPSDSVTTKPSTTVSNAFRNDVHDRNTGDTSDSSGNNGGTIAAVILSILVLVAAGALAVVWFMHKRRKQNLASPGSSDSLFSHYPDRAMTAPRHGMYAPRASQRPITLMPITMDSFPQYLELPPAPSPPVGIANRGYGISSKSEAIHASNGRPLPAAPTAENSHNALHYGYDEIHNVGSDDGLQTDPGDGYEVPVPLEEEDEEEEECIYDVARPMSDREDRPSLRNAMYMNKDSFSTHM